VAGAHVAAVANVDRVATHRDGVEQDAARPPVMRAALERLGVGLENVDPATWDSPVWGHGRRVGLCAAVGPLVTF
jgi:hypothetical protein